MHRLQVHDPRLQHAHAIEELHDRLVHLEVREGARGEEVLARDLIAIVEIGAAVPAGQGTFARLGGSRDVIALDADLRRDLAWPRASGLVPFQDTRIVPGAWSASANLARLEAHPEAGAPFVLRKRPRLPKTEGLLLGARPWEWMLVMGGAEQPAAEAHVVFLQNATYGRALGCAPRRGLGLARPGARVIIVPAERRPLEIQRRGGTATAPGV